MREAISETTRDRWQTCMSFFIGKGSYYIWKGCRAHSRSRIFDLSESSTSAATNREVELEGKGADEDVWNRKWNDRTAGGVECKLMSVGEAHWEGVVWRIAARVAAERWWRR